MSVHFERHRDQNPGQMNIVSLSSSFSSSAVTNVCMYSFKCKNCFSSFHLFYFSCFHFSQIHKCMVVHNVMAILQANSHKKLREWLLNCVWKGKWDLGRRSRYMYLPTTTMRLSRQPVHWYCYYFEWMAQLSLASSFSLNTREKCNTWGWSSRQLLLYID